MHNWLREENESVKLWKLIKVAETRLLCFGPSNMQGRFSNWGSNNVERHLPLFLHPSHFAKHKVNQLKLPATLLLPGKLSTTADLPCEASNSHRESFSFFSQSTVRIHLYLFFRFPGCCGRTVELRSVRHLWVVFPPRPPQSGRSESPASLESHTLPLMCQETCLHLNSPSEPLGGLFSFPRSHILTACRLL